MNKRIASFSLVVLFLTLVMTTASFGDTVYADNSASNLVNNTIGNQFHSNVVHDINLQGVNWNGFNDWFQRTAVIKYDQLPSVAAADVTSARLGLYLASLSDPGYGDKTVNVRPAQQSWDSATLTWANHPFGQDTFDWGPTPIADSQVINNTSGTPATLGWYWFDVTDVVKDWLDGTSTNNGLLIVPSNEDSNWTNFFFATVGDTNNAPQLEITYVPEPATMGLLALGGLVFFSRRNRKA